MARSPRRWLERQSLRRKLTLVVAAFAAGNLLLLALSTLAMDMLSTVRACVASGGQYSESQKDAVYELARYSRLGGEEAFERFRARLERPKAANAARREMQRDEPDLDAIVASLIESGIHPDDAAAMRKLLLRLRWLPNVRRAIDAWGAADSLIVELERLGGELHALRSTGTVAPLDEAGIVARVDQINDELTARMDEFAAALGAAGRRLRWVLFGLLLAGTVGFLGFGLALARAFGRHVVSGLERLHQGTERIGRGDLSGRIGHHGDDEVGRLAGAFDAMTDQLEVAVRERAAAAAELHERATELAATNARLSERQQQLAEAQAIAQVGSWEYDLATGNVAVSDELSRIVGHPPDAPRMNPEQYFARIHPDDRARVQATVAATMAGGPPYVQEYRLLHPDGGLRVIHGQGRVTRDEAGRPLRYLGTLQDVTERRALEERLRVADRLAAIGTLAGGVAHEINNPLSYLTANLGFVGDELARAAGGAPLDAELDGALREARLGAERIRRIVGDLKTFSRGDAASPSATDVLRAIEPAINMAMPEIRQRARLVRELAAVPPVLADEARLGQVVLNLLVNAAHAIEEGHVDTNTIRIVTKVVQPGRVLLEVHDTGAGIPPEIRGRIFEPFFTTKPIGGGTGLGLAICHGIVTSFGGELTVDTAVGRGSVFRVTLPVAEAEAPRPTAPTGPPSGRRGRILIVDDDPLVARGIRRALGRGHDVAIASDGPRALAMLADDRGFDLVLCDLMMPEMTGMAFLEALTARDAEMAARVVFVTGGAFTPAARDFLETTRHPILEKPLDPVALKALLRERIDGASDG